MQFPRSTRLLASAASLGLLLTACGGGGLDADSGDDATTEETGDDGSEETGEADAGGAAAEYDLSGVDYTVGSKDFTEQLILGHITVQALEAAGASVTDQVGLAGTNAARDALATGEIDLYWEYDGTGWGIHLGQPLDPEELPEDLYSAVAEQDLEENGIAWLEPAPFNNTYALAVRSEAYDELGVETISDVATLIEENPDEATLCVESEFASRDDGLPGLEAFYGFEFPEDNVSLVDTGVVYTETDAGACTFGEVFESDGRIAALDLTIIEDDQDFFPPYFPSITITEDKLAENEDIEGLAADLAGALDLETMQALNARVDVDGEFPEDVATDWLTENGFIGG